MSTQVWSNVQASMQSALGANLTITGITQANPGVATSTAHGLSNGDIVVLNVQGMYQIDKKHPDHAENGVRPRLQHQLGQGIRGHD